MTKIEEPVETIGMHDSKEYNHPAFGQITASRVSAGGGVTLFGSDFKHRDFIRISISRSQLNRNLSHDWYFPRGEIVEVYLSEAQWATFLSTLNHGTGTPCTIDRVGREKMSEIPPRDTVSQFQKEVKETVKDAVNAIDKSLIELEEILGASVSQKKKDAIMAGLRKARMEIASNLPFVEQSFGEHIERTKEKAKVEVEAYITNVISRAGLEALGGQAPLMLNSGEEKDGQE